MASIWRMNWKQIITDIQARGYTLERIATECDFASKGAVHDLKTSFRQKSCAYERGALLVELHKKVMRRKSAKKEQA